MKNILIRCDSSNIIGTGHVMRCLNLCEYYPFTNFTFICRNFKSNISEKIVQSKHKLILLEYDIEPELNNYQSWKGVSNDIEINDLLNLIKNNRYDTIIIDHYGIDHVIEKKIKSYCNKLIVISELFEFKHFCDLFINYTSCDIDKIKLININPNTQFKVGIQNCILNKYFINNQPKSSYNNNLHYITISMGGADPNNFTLQILNVIHDFVIKNSIIVNVIIGKSNNNKELINHFIMNISNYKLFFDLHYDKLINLLLDSDLVIGSLSTSSIERLILHIPQICIKIAENQTLQNINEFNLTKIDQLLNLLEKYPNINLSSTNTIIINTNLLD